MPQTSTMEERELQTLGVPDTPSRVGSRVSSFSLVTDNSEGVSFEQHRGDKLWVIVSRASFTYCVLLILIAISMEIAYIVNVDIVNTHNMNRTKACLYSVGIVGLAALLLIAVRGELTKNDHYRDRRKASFVRGGMLVLGTSGIMYRFLSIYEFLINPDGCRRSLDLILAIGGLVTTIMECGFLFVFAKIRINRTRSVALFARALVMHMIALNVGLWLDVVVQESLHEIMTLEATYEAEVLDEGAGYNISATPECPSYGLLKTLSPYLYPLIVEFSVVVTNLWLGIWENCGVGVIILHPSDADAASSRRKSFATDGVPMEKQTGYKNNNGGFLIGWLILILTLSLTLIYLFWVVGSGSNISSQQANFIAYSVNLALSSLLLIATIVATYRMHSLPSKGQDAKKVTGNRLRNKLAHLMDRRLLFGTSMALVIFKLNCLVAGSATGDYLIVADSVVSIFASMGQTMFIYAFALERICVTNYHRMIKPGRQSLELIRFTNLSLWIANTFMLKSPSAKAVQYEVFGQVGWVAISNVFQPLTILHYFHAMICVAEVVVDVYSDQNIYMMETLVEPDSEPHPVSKLPFQGIPFDYVPSLSSTTTT